MHSETDDRVASGCTYIHTSRVRVSFERAERCLPRIRSDRVISLGFRGWTNKKGERYEINRGDSLSQIRLREFSLAEERVRETVMGARVALVYFF